MATVTASQRIALGQMMDLLVQHEPKIHYKQVRPMATALIHNRAQLARACVTGFSMDCSESVTLLCRLAGMKDPNGLSYNGFGNTQEMYNHLFHYKNPKNAQLGALVFFGIPGQLKTQHVCMVRRAGRNPLLFSHGQERGPLLVRFGDEAEAHVGTPTFLSVARLG